MSFITRILLEKGLQIGDILDFRCGFGKAVEAINKTRLSVIGYDKH